METQPELGLIITTGFGTGNRNRNQSNLSILEPEQEALHESKEPAKAGKKTASIIFTFTASYTFGSPPVSK
jgi:hypothetical protein